MKPLTLDEQFLSNLEADQKAMVWEYYRLITDQSIDSIQQVSRISDIWSYAEHDHMLLAWLEFIDYFYTGVDEDAIPIAEKRTFLSEYLADKVDLLPEDFPSLVFEKLKCPGGKGYVAVMRSSNRNSIESTSFDEQTCSNCGRKYREHTVVTWQPPSLEP